MRRTVHVVAEHRCPAIATRIGTTFVKIPKICVFCGNPPQGKTREHILPQWLLRLTGDPARKVYLGRDWSKKDLPKRVFSFKSFTFPACASCNTRFAKLEADAQRVVTTMLSAGHLVADDFDILLDWLDKVRTGLWLGLRYLNANHRDISPQFAIASRIAARDRLVFVYRDEMELTGISLAGIESPIFQEMPSCFVISINHLHFFSASATSLFAARLGLPFPVNLKRAPNRDAGFLADISPGTGVVELPLVQFPIVTGGSQLFQPIIPHTNDPESKQNVDAAFATPYIQGMMRDPGGVRGKIVQVTDGGSVFYPTQPSADWLPPSQRRKFDLMADLAVANGEWQEALFRESMSISKELLDEEQRQFEAVWCNGTLNLHDAMMKHLHDSILATGEVTRFDPADS